MINRTSAPNFGVEPELFVDLDGAAEWNRTIDLTLTKGMLYRLSYGSNAAGTSCTASRGALYAIAKAGLQEVR